MQSEFYAKKKKTPEQLKRAARVRDAIRLDTKKPARRGPKRSVSY